ncbi:hypothetical protein [Zeaxanthinibacter enoshimensis]|uniref:Uncharacterized protein n=1 Tax=Zeaxanthinibacter enoshimensis TaxID=392009 RepID=A0A4R6TLT3_9FLAO|nr:hypothetical protein [Zeaxanthinibacter enoshimensis]TDQ32344.1 hypothetical protein CLV82_0169 [Zeaxanthinibacter enoshimensis]
MSQPNDRAIALLENAALHNLYSKTVAQLLKDFERANIPIQLNDKQDAATLTAAIHEKIYVLLLEKFADYLNLLYVIDVPEKAVKEIRASDAVEVSREITYLVLKREWQKVWLRSQMSG